MKLTGLSDAQKHALLDLLVLGMYADQHLASAENERLQRLLDAFALPSDYVRQQWIDDSCTRVRERQRTLESTRKFVAELATKFPDQATRLLAIEALENLLASDQRVSDDEKWFEGIVREGFGLPDSADGEP